MPVDEGGGGAAAGAAGGSCRDRPGCATAPKAVSSLVVPNANSCRLVLPMMMAPASRRRLTTGASVDAIGAAARSMPHVVGVPRDVHEILHR